MGDYKIKLIDLQENAEFEVMLTNHNVKYKKLRFGTNAYCYRLIDIDEAARKELSLDPIFFSLVDTIETLRKNTVTFG